ncbi:hypothetical protein TIFTF001_038323 [Ficus carica]|uniref:Uncharacterized protein n=1 Tax=Ficus carica TaxID=3494 RepID=A0AA88JCU0_FICCA|nr:hypothetical protein TIFTF001_038323 [Ficus carica]
MSDLSDSENAQMFEDAEVTGSSSSNTTGEAVEQETRTPDHLSGISDVPSPISPLHRPAGREKVQAGWKKFYSATCPGGRPHVWGRRRIREDGQPGQHVWSLRFSELREHCSIRGAHPGPPAGPWPNTAHQRPEEFWIPPDVELLVPDEGDLPLWPPPGDIALSTEYFRAGLRLPLHPYLRRALTRLNVVPMQLNANAYRILASCFILWTKNFVAELPFRAFQNLYRMKSTPSSSGSYYFQSYKGHSSLGARTPTSSSSTCGSSLVVDGYMVTSHPERNHHKLLSPASLEEYNWIGSSSTSDHPDDRPRTAQPGEVTVARMSEPVVHYCSRTVTTAGVATTFDRSEVPRGVPVATVHDLQSGNSSPGTSGPRVADDDMDLNQWPSGSNAGGKAESSAAAPSSQAGTAVLTDRTTSDPLEAWAIVAKFDDKLTSEVAELSRRFNPIVAIDDCAEKLIEALCLAFSGSAAVRRYANCVENDVFSTKTEAKSARNVEKKVEDKAKEIGKKLKDAEKRASEAEDARRKAEDDLAATRSEHSRSLMRPLLKRAGHLRSRRVTEEAREVRDVVILDEPEQIAVPEQAVIPGQKSSPDQATLPYQQIFILMSDFGRCLTWGPVSIVRGPLECGICLSKPRVGSYSDTSYGWLGCSMESTQVQLWSVSSVGTSRGGPGTTGVRGLPEQTLSWVMLGHLLWLAWVVHGIDPSPTLVSSQHGDLSRPYTNLI